MLARQLKAYLILGIAFYVMYTVHMNKNVVGGGAETRPSPPRSGGHGGGGYSRSLVEEENGLQWFNQEESHVIP